MFVKFEKEMSILTERSTTMGLEEVLLDSAEKQGIKKGMEEGIAKTTMDIATKMKQSGCNLTLIANITGLSAQEIEKSPS